MGRTPLPLTIVVWPSLAGLPDFEGLAGQGHHIIRADALPEGFDLSQADLVIGPACQWWEPRMVGRLDKTLKRVRAQVRERRKREDE